MQLDLVWGALHTQAMEAKNLLPATGICEVIGFRFALLKNSRSNRVVALNLTTVYICDLTLKRIKSY